MIRYTLIALVLVLCLSACGSNATPSLNYELGDVIYTNNFDNPDTWESFGLLDTQFGIGDGTYNAISPGGGYVVVTNSHVHQNVVIEVTASQSSTETTTSYGIECRAQVGNNSVGYYFMLSSSGRYGIRRGDGGRVVVLVEWTESNLINKGVATNKIRAVCIDDYLAMYVNDVFVAEARYDWLEEGNMGLVVNSPESTTIAVRFDDVTIWDASLVESSQ